MFKIINLPILIACVLFFSSSTFANVTCGNYTWQDIGISISGLAKIQEPVNGAAMSFIGVVDTKSKRRRATRVVLVNIDENDQVIMPVQTLKWPRVRRSHRPLDLESIAAIPNTGDGTNQQFMAVNSSGNFWRFSVDTLNNTVINLTTGHQELNNGDSDSKSAKEIESVAFYMDPENNNQTNMVWATRGSADHSASIYYAELENHPDYGFPVISDPHRYKVQEDDFSWPRIDGDHSRLISDLKIETGSRSIYISSAFDGGDKGPFGGMLYNIGNFTSENKMHLASTRFEPRLPENLFEEGDQCGKKIEAIEMLNSSDASEGFILGSDDEDLGGFVLIVRPSTY